MLQQISYTMYVPANMTVEAKSKVSRTDLEGELL